MSVQLCISFPGRETECIPVSGQRTFEDWLVGEVGKKHGFKFFAGPCPLFVWDNEQDKAYEVGNWDRIITRLKQLRDEEGWQADFG